MGQVRHGHVLKRQAYGCFSAGNVDDAGFAGNCSQAG